LFVSFVSSSSISFSSNQHVRSKGNTKKEIDRKGSILSRHILIHPYFYYFIFFLSGSLSADRQYIMTPGINDLLDPSVCSCIPTSSHYMFCRKIKWSTLSISTALVIIVSKWYLHIYLLVFSINRSSMLVVDCTL